MNWVHECKLTKWLKICFRAAGGDNIATLILVLWFKKNGNSQVMQEVFTRIQEVKS